MRLFYSVTILLMVFVIKLQSQTTMVTMDEREQLVRSIEQSHNRLSVPHLNATLPSTVKCGFGLSFEVARNWNDFSFDQKRRLMIALAPSDFQRDTVIGHFRIFYDVTGANEPALLDIDGNRIPNTAAAYVDSVGKYLNIVWEKEINDLKYDTSFMNGRSYYSMYVESLSGIYGETVFTDSNLIPGFSPPRYTSYIRIDNDYQNFMSSGMAGLKVTLAHEFHHAIQIGSYGFWDSDQYFYEITSTWMEDVVFTEVNDYYYYLTGGQFLTPDITFSSMRGVLPYSRGIWGKFIEKKYSPDVMLHTWGYIRNEKTLLAIDQALTDIGSSFRQAFLEWTIWNYNTGAGCDTINYYSEGRAYPSMTYKPTVQFVKSTSRSFTDSIQVLSSVYHPVCVCNNDSEMCSSCPQMLTIITNLNIDNTATGKFGFRYDLSGIAISGYSQLSNGVYYHLDVSDPENWTSQETVEKIIANVLVYPNPFIVRGNRPLTFKLPQPISSEEGTLYIFSSSMDRIFFSTVPLLSRQFEPKIQWSGLDSRGDTVPSGIYFYIVSVDGKQYKGKFAAVR